MIRRILLLAGFVMLAGCTPDSGESLALCREEAGEVIEVSAAEFGLRRNRHIEHCMRAFGYVWDHAQSGCGSYETFRDGEKLTENAGLAGTCFRHAHDERSRLAERVADWFD